MKLLWDTHTFLWFIAGNAELSENVKREVVSPDNENYISIVSLWEISIKTALGKLQINGDYTRIIDDIVNNGIRILAIDFSHTVEQNQLPFIHRDPFDRLIVAQSIVEGMMLVSKDRIFDDYLVNKPVHRIW